MMVDVQRATDFTTEPTTHVHWFSEYSGQLICND